MGDQTESAGPLTIANRIPDQTFFVNLESHYFDMAKPEPWIQIIEETSLSQKYNIQ